ncbi:carboxyl-terminal peptidase, partial [Trifolium medium]|nr:carboxyl-terminal peptidase [Trifolium medium]
TDESYHIGGPITKTSTYGGEMVEMPISIHQDEYGNWVLRLVDRDIGHFPKVIFENMLTADQVGWGGSTSTPAGKLGFRMILAME